MTRAIRTSLVYFNSSPSLSAGGTIGDARKLLSYVYTLSHSQCLYQYCTGFDGRIRSQSISQARLRTLLFNLRRRAPTDRPAVSQPHAAPRVGHAAADQEKEQTNHHGDLHVLPPHRLF